MSKYMVLTFDGVKVNTGKARLLIFGDREEWIPESQIGYIDEEEGEVLVTQWCVLDKGLEAYEK